MTRRAFLLSHRCEHGTSASRRHETIALVLVTAMGCTQNNNLLLSLMDAGNVADSGASDADGGAWQNVTPPGIMLDQSLFGGDNFGVMDVVVDPARPSDLYAFTSHQGVWRSTDYGESWGTGPINTGLDGSLLTGKLWCSAIANATPTTAPTLWTCNNGGQLGIWKSTNGGVDWENYPTFPTALGQDPGSLAIDPHDPLHLLAGFDGAIAESTNGGTVWNDRSGNIDPTGIAYVPIFLDTAAGDATVTRSTWLAIPQSNGSAPTSRTSDGGTTWMPVETLQHPTGGSQTYQAGGITLMTGSYGSQGGGIYRSADLGVSCSWSHQSNLGGSAVWGTARYAYAMFGWASVGGGVNPSFAIASWPTTTDWHAVPTPSGLVNGPKSVAVTFDGMSYIAVGGMWRAGIWRYVEPP